MKKILLTAFAVAAFGVAQAQEEMSFGAKAGLNIADLGSDAETDGSLIGFHVGGVAEFPISENFSIQPELLYSMQGAKVVFVDEFDVMEADLKLSYINVPIMAKYYIMEGLSLEVGPQIGFLMSAKVDDEDVKDGYKSIDFGLNGGVGYKTEMGLFFQARYNAGLAAINEEFEGDGGAKVTNNVISFSVGYKF